MRAALALILISSTAAADNVNLLTSVPAVVAVSSTVDNKTILPEHLVDGKLDTAWNSKTSELAGAWVGVRLPATVHVATIKLTVGFTKIDKKLGDLFTMNPRIKHVRVTRDGKAIAEQDLDPDVRGLQEIAIDGGGGDYKLEVTAFVPGTKKAWREINVSELEVWGTLTSGTPKAQKPIVRVGSFEQSALSKAECVKAMFPAAKAQHVDADPDSDTIVGFASILLGGDVDMCRIDHVGRGTTDDPVAELAAVKRSPRLAVVQRLPPVTVFKHGDNADMGGFDEASLTWGTMPLTTTETALIVEQTSHRWGGSFDRSTSSWRLYRVSSTAITKVLDLASTSRSESTGDSDTCTLIQPAIGTALPDLQVECEQTHSGYGGDKSDKDTRSTRTEAYRWKGGTYVKRK